MSAHESSSLRTKVAGRMAGVFLVCAGFPLAVLAALTIVRTTAELSTGAKARLRYEASTLENEALNRVHRLAEGLQSLTRALELDDSASLRGIKLSDHLPAMPRAAVVRLSDGRMVRLVGDLPIPTLSAVERLHLAQKGRLIVAGGESPILVVRGMRPGALAATTVSEAWVFGLDEAGHLPPDSAVCVVAAPYPPRCSMSIAPEFIASVIANVQQADATIPAPAGEQMAWVSTLELTALYKSAPWKFALMRPSSIIRAPIQRFVQDTVVVVGLMGLIVVWIVGHQVRRQLRPLAALTSATTQLRRHELHQAVDIGSDDEFGLLGEAFNDMAGELRQQFADLEAFNIGTLTTLARVIDAKSPWTAGHSERVTALAVRIATALDLPPDEVDLIRKGALVHDIGKIATPIEILDKPTRLTKAEEGIMRLHPERGVHILEPIPAFGPVLPIVGQHHERWDGTGYPARLSGKAIARTARVVAVADVYDALRSDRPYRSGLPHVRIVNLIRTGAGALFDPVVVAAFLRIEADLDSSTAAGVTHARKAR